MMLSAVSSVMVMMRAPPGDPRTRKTDPSRVTNDGAIDESGRLPGAIALARPCTSPNRLAAPGLEVKSSISSFISTPVPGAMAWAPNAPLIV